jgi:hypothetical protein
MYCGVSAFNTIFGVQESGRKLSPNSNGVTTMWPQVEPQKQEQPEQARPARVPAEEADLRCAERRSPEPKRTFQEAKAERQTGRERQGPKQQVTIEEKPQSQEPSLQAYEKLIQEHQSSPEDLKKIIADAKDNLSHVDYIQVVESIKDPVLQTEIYLQNASTLEQKEPVFNLLISAIRQVAKILETSVRDQKLKTW